MDLEDFVNLGNNKVIFVIASYDDLGERAYHPNVLITNKTTFSQYWDDVKEHVTEKFISGSHGYRL